MSELVNDKIEILKEKIAKLLAEYREKHDELDIAVEEWDIAEIQVALEQGNKEILKLKKQVHDLEVA
jgi:type I restriction-modification system DNA methylase subunit